MISIPISKPASKSKYEYNNYHLSINQSINLSILLHTITQSICTRLLNLAVHKLLNLAAQDYSIFLLNLAAHNLLILSIPALSLWLVFIHLQAETWCRLAKTSNLLWFQKVISNGWNKNRLNWSNVSSSQLTQVALMPFNSLDPMIIYPPVVYLPLTIPSRGGWNKENLCNLYSTWTP